MQAIWQVLLFREMRAAPTVAFSSAAYQTVRIDAASNRCRHELFDLCTITAAGTSWRRSSLHFERGALTMTYTLTAHPNTIVRDEDDAFIPTDPDNTDYQVT